MGVFTRLRPAERVAKELDPKEPLAVISCNNCVKVTGAGGEGVWEPFCDELRKQGFRIEDRVLITNPCSRGYLENLSLSPAVTTVVMLACTGAQHGFKTLFPDLKLVPAVDSMGLFVVSKADGVVKLAATYPGYEDLLGKEYKLKDAHTELEGEKLSVSKEVQQ